MHSMFRKVILASTVGVAATLTANTALAANIVHVPFNFTVAGKTLPAGNYDVKHQPTGGFVTLEDMASSQSFTWILIPGGPGPYDKKVSLKFDNRNDAHVLQSIQYGPMVTPRLDKDEKHINSERDSRGQ
jgi:hypothetical protein